MEEKLGEIKVISVQDIDEERTFSICFVDKYTYLPVLSE